MAIKHAFSNAIADGGDPSIVRPSDWNSQHNLTYALSGNTAGSSQISGQDVTFVGSNNVTLSADTAASKLVFMGPDLTQYLTTAMQSNAATISNVRMSAGTTSNLLSAVTFADSNGVSFGLNAGTITATVKTDYLTTAMASNRGSDFVQANAAFAGTNASGTIASNGISISVGNYLTTAAQSSASNVSGVIAGSASNAATNQSVQLSGAVSFANTNGVSFYTTENGAVSGIAATVATNYQSQGAYLTTARASNDAVGLNTALTAGPLAWTVNSAGISLNAGSAAGTSTGFAGTNISGSMTHNTAGLSINLSVAAPGAGGGVAVAAGTQTATSGTVVFSNSNGITFGLSGSTRVTASHNGISRFDIYGNNLGGPSGNGPVINPNFSRNITGSYSNNDGYLRFIGEFQPTLSNLGNTAGNTGTYQGPLVLAGSNNITLSQSTGTFTTGATDITGTRATITVLGPDLTQYLTTAALSNHSHGFSAQGGSSAFQTLGFSNANNVSFSNSNGSVVGSASFAQSNQSAIKAFGVSNTGNTAGNTGVSSGIDWVLAGSGSITLSQSTAVGGPNTAWIQHPAWLTTAMQSNAATISNVRMSAGTTSNLLSAVTFADSNGISFGLNAGTITATVATTYRASNDAVGLNTALTAGPLAWTVNSSGISLNAGSVAGTSSGFTGANISGSMTHNTAGLALSLSVAGPQAGVGIAAGTRTATTAGNLLFSNANGITFGLDAVGGSVMTASHNGLTTAMASNAATISNVNISAGTTSTNASAFTFSNANNITWGLGTGASAGNITASFNPIGIGVTNSSASGTTGTIDGAGGQYLFFGMGDVTLSQSINGKSASLSISAGNTIDGFTNPQIRVNPISLGYNQSTSHVVPFILPADLSFDFIRMEFSGAILAASTTAATTGATQFSCGYTKSHNFHLYSRGSGASSDSLQLVKSTQFVENFSNNISCAANSTQFSYSNRYTYPCSTGNLGFTNDYSSSAASINANSASATAYTGSKFIDFPFGTVLTAGCYWLMYGNSTSSAAQAAGTTIGVRNAVTFNPVLLSQGALSIGTLGAATSNIYGPQQGIGSFTTVGGATTGSLNITKITVSAAHPQLSFQLMRTA